MIGAGIKRGTAELAVLSVLEDGPLHGYEMARRLEPRERAEVIEELARHLIETFEGLRRQGFTEEDAAQQCMTEVKDWHDLRRRIQSARRKEDIMTNRIKQFWIPGLLTFVLAMSFLALLQKFGPKPWVVALRGVLPVATLYIPWLLSLPLIGSTV